MSEDKSTERFSDAPGVVHQAWMDFAAYALKPIPFPRIPAKPLTKRQKVSRFWRNRKYNLGERLSKIANKLGYYDDNY